MYWYHGTNAEFEAFEKGENRMADRAAIGFWFADFDTAATFGNNVLQVELDLRRPKRISQRDLDFLAVSVPAPDIVRQFQSEGYDGLIIEEVQPDFACGIDFQAEQRVAFSPEQITIVDRLQAKPTMSGP